MKPALSSVAFVVLGISPILSAADWHPVTPAELALKTPKIDPAADAEVLFWEVRVEDRLQGSDVSLAMDHYIRIKIFTERGKERYSTVEIPLIAKRSLVDIAGRTIKPDGSTVDLKKESIFDRDLLKTKGVKLRGKSLALPNVEVGDIIEYRYREVRDYETASHMRLYFQKEIPIWRVTYRLKPLNVPYLPYTMRTMAFQCPHTPFERDASGFYSTSLTDVPAFQTEPDMPPQDQLMAWVLVYYELDRKLDPVKLWKEVAKQDYSRFKPLMKVDNTVKSAAAEITAGAESPEDKLSALDRFCRTKVKNLDSGAFRVTGEEERSLKENHSPADTLKQMAGRGMDIELLFAALANAAGFEARMARVPDRGDIFFSWKHPTTYFLKSMDVAVKVGERWILFDPATPYLEPGMLRWQDEAQQALVSDPKEGIIVETHCLPPSRSMFRRRATFRLSEDGTLEGTVRYTFNGHVGREWKQRYQDLSVAEQEEDWKTRLQGRLSSLELTDFEIKNISDPFEPVIVSHKVTVPGYATRTGKRILVQPSFFEVNRSPRYTASTRKWDLYFNYPWAEDDEVILNLPAGWVLDQPMAPESSKLGNVGEYSVELLKMLQGSRLVYRRHFEWGRGLAILIPVAGYPQVKKTFDWIRDQDEHSISLKQEKGGGDAN